MSAAAGLLCRPPFYRVAAGDTSAAGTSGARPRSRLLLAVGGDFVRTGVPLVPLVPLGD